MVTGIFATTQIQICKTERKYPFPIKKHASKEAIPKTLLAGIKKIVETCKTVKVTQPQNTRPTAAAGGQHVTFQDASMVHAACMNIQGPQPSE